MKKSILIVSMLMITILSSAQVENHLKNNNGTDRTLFRTTNSNSQNRGLILGINGGTAINGNLGFLNLKENNHLFFGTNDTERVRILRTGQVGVNTSTPSEFLDVNGNGRFRSITAGSNDFITTHESNGTLHQLAFTGNGNDVLLGNGTFGPAPGGTGIGDDDWLVSGNNMTAIPTGNVGIGTSTLPEKLNIEGIANTYIQVNSANSASRVGIKMGSATITKYGPINPSLADLLYINNGLDNDIRMDFKNLTFRGGSLEIGRITADANGQLLIHQNTPGTGRVSITNKAGFGLSGLAIESGAIDGTSSTGQTISTKALAGANPTGLSIITESAGIGGSNTSTGIIISSTGATRNRAMSVTAGDIVVNNGRIGVGILTNNPLADLDVIGSFRLKNGSEGLGKVLVSDADGNATWQDPCTICNNTQVTLLEERIIELEKIITEANLSTLLPSNINHEFTEKRIELKNSNAIILDQNSPNPFKEKTTINYNIPENVVHAKILFYDLNGHIINQLEINDRGNGRITVYGEDLESGIYTYSLITDNKLIDTKKMIKQ